jgi:hypothetical protein
MDTIKTKEELTADVAVLSSKMEALETKAGADAFIATEIASIDAVLSKVPERAVSDGCLSMRQVLLITKKLAQLHPEARVKYEMERTTISLNKAKEAVALADAKPILEEPLEEKP